ncbi:hypothetical protein EVJ58_g2514 [Rhodofomes roseus]|uniref:Uncharacterized protein n=1 Tax=Rhodofomes roseus TaxID=34475 RepID=A0A4Y9YSU9_9APHY|nr:hypothetical protein EVJ58_g2514 [Rhodofomes roseus]
MDFMAQPQEQSPAGISDIVLFSHVLRLRLVRQVPSGIHKASGGADLGHEERVGDLVEQFYDELLSARVSGMLAALVDVDDNLISLVNTIIYIGMSRRNLNIVSRFRTGADSRFISRSLHIMATLITIRPDMGYPVLRQICWGIWMLSMPTSKILSGLLVPVVQSTTELAPSLSELLRLDREGETSFCYAALGLLDYTIWWEMEHHHQLLSANPTSLGVELKEAAELRDALLDKYIALLNSLMSLQSPAIATKGNPSLNPEGPEQWTKQMLQPFRTYFKSRVATRTTARPLPGSGGADAAQAAGVSLPKHSTLTRVRFTRHVLRICGSALELKRRHSKLPISRWQDVLRTSCYYLARLTTDLNRLPSSLDERGRVSGLWSDGELVFLRVVLVKFTGWVIRSCLRRSNEQPAEHATAHDMSFIDDLLLRQDHSIAPNPETLVADIASSIEAAYNIVTDAQKYLTILSLRQSAWTIGAFLTCLEGLLTEARLHQPVQVALRSYFKRQNPQDDDQSHSPMRMIMHLDFTISGELRGHAEQESSGGWPPFNLTEACFKAIRVDLHNMAGSGDKFSSHRGDADRAANSSHPPTSPILDSLEAGGATNERSNVP